MVEVICLYFSFENEWKCTQYEDELKMKRKSMFTYTHDEGMFSQLTGLPVLQDIQWSSIYQQDWGKIMVFPTDHLVLSWSGFLWYLDSVWCQARHCGCCLFRKHCRRYFARGLDCHHFLHLQMLWTVNAKAQLTEWHGYFLVRITLQWFKIFGVWHYAWHLTAVGFK